MKNVRRSLYLLVAALVIALSVAAVAVAVAPGDWTDSKRNFTISVANDGKRISGFVWNCKSDRSIVRAWPHTPGPKIRRRGRFSFKGKASVVANGVSTGSVRLRVKGRFRTTKRGKWVAVGTVKARGCGKKAKRFRAKRPAGAQG